MSEKQSTIMTAKEFYAELEKTAPKLYKKLTTITPSNSDGAKFGPKEIIEAIKKEAPKLYEKMKTNNFQIQLDDETRNEWGKTMEESKVAVKRIMKAYEDFHDK